MSQHEPTPFEKALTWHQLGKGFSPNAESVKHVEAILAELERVKPPTANRYVLVADGIISERRDTWSAPLEVIITEERDGRLELVFRYTTRPDPALLERIRNAVASAEERRFIAVAIDIEDVQQLLAVFGEQRPASAPAQ